MKKKLTTEAINKIGYYPLNDCQLLHFVRQCPAKEYNLSECSQCPFESAKGNDYFLMEHYRRLPIRQVVQEIMKLEGFSEVK